LQQNKNRSPLTDYFDL